jgi:predicted metalloprotease with PDZ domain
MRRPTIIKSNETTRQDHQPDLFAGRDGRRSDGVLSAVQWGRPAFNAGLITGTTIVAVNGEAYDADKLKDAIKAASKSDGALVELLVKEGSRYRMVKIDYRGGLRYPRLERVAGTPARLDDILAARK